VHAFGRWVTREVDFADDIVHACEIAARAPLPDHCEVATGATREVLRKAGVDPAEAHVTVHRQRGRLRALITLPERDRELESRVVIAVLGALRHLDTYADGIDVSIEGEDS
jgi:hypothetical protein